MLLVRRSIQAEMQHSPPKKEFKILLALYGGLIVHAVSVLARDSEYMVLQDQESAQGLPKMAVKVKQVLVFKEQHGVLFICALVRGRCKWPNSCILRATFSPCDGQGR